VNVKSFSYIADPQAKILILGSMPGVMSLDQQQYYAHPRNSFWPIMLNLLKLPSDLSYSEKTLALMQHYIALWDVLQSCIRPGSLDSAIDMSSVAINDFNHFFRCHPQIQAVFFNGQKAESVFQKRVLPHLSSELQKLTFQRLPSTSPAHAALSFNDKLNQWRTILQFLPSNKYDKLMT